MADTKENTEITNDSVTSENLSTENEDISNDVDWKVDKEQTAIQNLIKKYWTPEELAKAKRESDKKISEIIAEKKAIEKMLQDEKVKSLKKSQNKKDLLDAYSEDPELADKVALELFWKSVVDLDEDLWDYNVIEDDQWNQFMDLKEVDKLVEMKMKKLLASQKKEEIEKTNIKTKEEKIASFIDEKWVDSEEFMSYVSEFEALWDIDKVLKAAYASYFSDIYEDNDKITKMKEKAAKSMVSVSKKWTWDSLSYTEEDLAIAKFAKMSIEKYMAFKNEQAKKWKALYQN